MFQYFHEISSTCQLFFKKTVIKKNIFNWCCLWRFLFFSILPTHSIVKSRVTEKNPRCQRSSICPTLMFDDCLPITSGNNSFRDLSTRRSPLEPYDTQEFEERERRRRRERKKSSGMNCGSSRFGRNKTSQFRLPFPTFPPRSQGHLRSSTRSSHLLPPIA